MTKILAQRAPSLVSVRESTIPGLVLPRTVSQGVPS